MNAMDRLAVNEKRRDVDVLMETATKHYMRRDVWLPIAKERGQQLDKPIRYFTLTTLALFDVKLLEQDPRLATCPVSWVHLIMSCVTGNCLVDCQG